MIRTPEIEGDEALKGIETLKDGEALKCIETLKGSEDLKGSEIQTASLKYSRLAILKTPEL